MGPLRRTSDFGGQKFDIDKLPQVKVSKYGHIGCDNLFEPWSNQDDDDFF